MLLKKAETSHSRSAASPKVAEGRWFVVWRCLEEPEEAPEEVRWTVLRISLDAEDGHGNLTFSEV